MLDAKDIKCNRTQSHKSYVSSIKQLTATIKSRSLLNMDLSFIFSLSQIQRKRSLGRYNVSIIT